MPVPQATRGGVACRFVGTLDQIAQERTDLARGEVEWLHGLIATWGLVSDLGLSDLVLWLPTWNDGGWVAAAQVRPATAATSVPDDVVGTFTPRGRRPELDRARLTGRVDPATAGRCEAIPVAMARSGRAGEDPDRVLGVISRHPTDRGEGRPAGRLESEYLEIARLLLGMVAEGRYPPAGWGAGADAPPPRAGDGLLRLSEDGRVAFASPNAISAFRRLGLAPDLVGSDLAHTAVRLWHRPGPVDESLALVASGRVAGDAEVENRSASVTLRAVPLFEVGRQVGAVVLVRDITDLRRRERALLSKDATLREVHHRVKNNLQTVSALLRLQSRRVSAEEARDALAEAERRVSAIAAVHDILSQEPGETIDFDDVAERLTHLAGELMPARPNGATPRIVRSGSMGEIPTDVAGPLAMALSEIVQNAVEHAGAELIEVRSSRQGDAIVVEVLDDGAGVPAAGPDQPGLGLQIVRMLIEEDLGGEVRIGPRPEGGTLAGLSVPLGG